MHKRPLVVGNWKMYVETPEEAKKFCSALRRTSRVFSGVEVVLLPAFPLISAATAGLKGAPIKVGAQTLSAYQGGAHTGEVSAAMLKSAGVSFCVAGHSERRADGETDEVVAAQMAQAHTAGLTVILCVGEQERDTAGAFFSVIEKQLSSALPHAARTSVQKLVVAYEPVWAIGKSAGEAMQASDVREMVIFIRKTLAAALGRAAAERISILYGGSVDSTNAAQLLSEGGISGFLVGRASTQTDSFLQLLKICQKK